MSSSLVDCRLSERGRDGPRGHGDDKSQGVAASPGDRQVREKRITQREAGTLLGLPDRQIRSLLRCVEQEGDQGLVHRGRGTPSNRRMAEPAKRRCCGCMRVTMGTLGRRWRWRNWPSSMGLPSARFYGYEGTIPALDSFQRYIRQDGVPLAIYADKHTTYRSPVEATVEEQRAGTTPKSQCGQAGGRWGSS
jgi:hypothetical protein